MSTSPSILFISTEEALWGGSDELWHSAALVLVKQGYSVAAFKSRWSTSHDRYKALVNAGISVWSLYDNPTSYLAIRPSSLESTRIGI